jgi:tRNA 2-(methylsulfanyl)-N6-isopentenyladenosine37 hydroxylase
MMLHLVGETSTAWVDHAIAHFEQVLVDHAHCEHKAAVTALSFVSKYPDDPRLVVALGELARDEAGHFVEVAALCTALHLPLGHPDKDPYVDQLLSAVRNDNVLLSRVDRLLCCALIEGRSCERLRLLATALAVRVGQKAGAVVVDAPIVALYERLWREEATHHLLFIELAARSLDRAGDKDAAAKVQARLAELAAHEGQVLKQVPLRAAIH